MVGKTVISAKQAGWAEQREAQHSMIAGASSRWASQAQHNLPLQDSGSSLRVHMECRKFAVSKTIRI